MADRRRGGIGGHTKPYRGRSDEWLTPPEILETLGPFDLDPCAPARRPWPTATMHYTVYDDGLAKPWHGRVWLNPPYGPQTARWLARLASHGDGIALIFARTETRMFFTHVWARATGLLFLAGRPHFRLPDGAKAAHNSGGPLVLIAYGAQNLGALATSNLRGALVTKWTT